MVMKVCTKCKKYQPYIDLQKCSKCKQEKQYTEFNKDITKKTGLHNQCKVCIKKYREKLLNSKRTIASHKICSICKIDKPASKFWKSKHTINGLYPSCIECKSKREKKPDRQIIRANNRKTWRKKNIIRARELWNNWDKKRRKVDPVYRLRRSVMHAISNKITKKHNKEHWLTNTIFDYLPYTVIELKNHIESLWEPWMSWDNYGKYDSNNKTWQIDHIIPQSKLPYDSMEHPNFKKCWALENLQPLETVLNIKKSNK